MAGAVGRVRAPSGRHHIPRHCLTVPAYGEWASSARAKPLIPQDASPDGAGAASRLDPRAPSYIL